MTLAFACFATIGAWIAAKTRSIPAGPARVSALWTHAGVNVASVACACVGGWAIYANKENKGRAHLTSWHSWVGIVALGLTAASPALGAVAFARLGLLPERAVGVEASGQVDASKKQAPPRGRSGAYHLTLVPIRPRSRCERRSLRTFGSLPLAFLSAHPSAVSTLDPSTPFNSDRRAFRRRPDPRSVAAATTGFLDSPTLSTFVDPTLRALWIAALSVAAGGVGVLLWRAK